MSDVETWLREELQSAVPRSMDSSGLLAAVHEQAGRARRMRVAVVASTVVAVLAVAGAVLTGAAHQRALVPARPVSHLYCSQQAAAPAATLPLPPGPLSRHLREVVVCADRSAASVWRGSLPLDNQVSIPGDLNYLRLDLPADQRCPTMPAGPAYRFLLLDQAGQVSAVDNRRLACNGWPALNRYFIAQGDQLATERAIQLTDPFPKCSSMLHAQLRPASGAAAALPKGTVVTAAALCGHPLADDLATPAKEPQPVGRTILSAEQLTRLTRDLATRGSAKGLVTCQLNRQWLMVLHAVTATGATFTLTGWCTHSGVLYVNDAKDDTITLLPATARDLTQ